MVPVILPYSRRGNRRGGRADSRQGLCGLGGVSVGVDNRMSFLEIIGCIFLFAFFFPLLMLTVTKLLQNAAGYYEDYVLVPYKKLLIKYFGEFY